MGYVVKYQALDYTMEKNILRFFANFSRLTVGQWRRRRHFE